MINIESFIHARYPALSNQRPLLAKSLIGFLKFLFHEKEFQKFGEDYPNITGSDFVAQVLEYFGFSYSVPSNERLRIPEYGRVVIVANHPIGSLDGLSLIQMVHSVRPDVKVVANDILANVEKLQPLLLPVDNMNGNTPRKNLKAIHNHLEKEGALIIFPAGTVSRFGPTGIKDKKWNKGFVQIAKKTQSPILPVFIDGRNSAFFYFLSIFARPLSTWWLVREMFKQTNHSLQIRIGNIVSHKDYMEKSTSSKELARLFQKHTYRLGDSGKPVFTVQKSVAPPENRQQLKREIRKHQLLGMTGDNKQIYLCTWEPDSSIMREIGRLRELTFRAVGEGTGEKRDLDDYDCHYLHIVLWDDVDLEIAGSYRIAQPERVISPHGKYGLYTSTLYNYKPHISPVFNQGLEMGRSFVQPRYWGKRSLDYLWYGIGAYVRSNSHIRFLFGAVTISDEYPDHLKAAIIYFYTHYFPAKQEYASARNPFDRNKVNLEFLSEFDGNDYKNDLKHLKQYLANEGYVIPTLYKQYPEICEPQGIQFIDFNIDPDFQNCVCGLIIVDLEYLKPKKRARYLDNNVLEGLKKAS